MGTFFRSSWLYMALDENYSRAEIQRAQADRNLDGTEQRHRRPPMTDWKEREAEKYARGITGQYSSKADWNLSDAYLAALNSPRVKALEAVAEAARAFKDYTSESERHKESAEVYMSRRLDLGTALAALDALGKGQR
jgi:hypothetical protein